MNKEMEETVLQVADYSNYEKQRLGKRFCYLLVAGLISFTGYLVMEFFGIEDTFMDGRAAGTALGFTYGMMIVGILYTCGYLEKIKAFKMKLIKRK